MAALINSPSILLFNFPRSFTQYIFPVCQWMTFARSPEYFRYFPPPRRAYVESEHVSMRWRDGKRYPRGQREVNVTPSACSSRCVVVFPERKTVADIRIQPAVEFFRPVFTGCSMTVSAEQCLLLHPEFLRQVPHVRSASLQQRLHLRTKCPMPLRHDGGNGGGGVEQARPSPARLVHEMRKVSMALPVCTRRAYSFDVSRDRGRRFVC